MLVADVDFPTPPLWFVSTIERVMLDSSLRLRVCLNKTARETHNLPTRAMLLGGSTVSLRDGASRWAGRDQGSTQLTAKADSAFDLAFVREAQELCALGEYQVLEEVCGTGLWKMFGLSPNRGTKADLK